MQNYNQRRWVNANGEDKRMGNSFFGLYLSFVRFMGLVHLEWWPIDSSSQPISRQSDGQDCWVGT